MSDLDMKNFSLKIKVKKIKEAVNINSWFNYKIGNSIEGRRCFHRSRTEKNEENGFTYNKLHIHNKPIFKRTISSLSFSAKIVISLLLEVSWCKHLFLQNNKSISWGIFCNDIYTSSPFFIFLDKPNSKSSKLSSSFIIIAEIFFDNLNWYQFQKHIFSSNYFKKYVNRIDTFTSSMLTLLKANLVINQNSSPGLSTRQQNVKQVRHCKFLGMVFIALPFSLIRSRIYISYQRKCKQM